MAWATAPEYGAVVSFLGTTRSPNRGEEVAFLEYEAYPEMAEKVMAEILAEMRARWPLGRIALWHRLGRVDPGRPPSPSSSRPATARRPSPPASTP